MRKSEGMRVHHEKRSDWVRDDHEKKSDRLRACLLYTSDAADDS